MAGASASDIGEFALALATGLTKMRKAHDLNMPVTLTDEENKAIIRTINMMRKDKRR